MKQRAILPAPRRAESSSLWPQSDEQVPYVKRRTVAACVNCRQKKRKCSGLRPICDQCREDHIDCVYDTAPGETVHSMQKTRNLKRENDLITLNQLFWHLQTSDPADVTETLAAIRSGKRPDQIVRILKDKVPGSSSENGNEGTTVSETRTTSEVDSSPQSRAIYTATSSVNAITALQRGVEAFFLCAGSIFHIYEESVAQEMLKVARQYIQSGGRLWSQRMIDNSVPTTISEALCSVCIMAAIGLQYDKDFISALASEPSEDDKTPEYTDICYSTAKHHLENLIDHDVTKATKVCAGMCAFNVIRHSTIAIAYADMGITIALAAYPNLQEQPFDISKQTWTSHRRTMRTLLTLRAWLTVSLGLTPGNKSQYLVMKQCLTDDNDVLPQDIIQQELAKVIQIEVGMLKEMERLESFSPQLLASTRDDLSLWHQQLPHWMSLDVLIEAHELARNTRWTIFLVHLFYLSAYVLLARLAYEPEDDRFTETEQARTAISDGVLAARTAARILKLQLDERAIFQRCWLCEFTAYTSSLLLLHSAVYLKLSEHPQYNFLAELSYVKICLDVLDYCGEADDVALRFGNTIRPFYDTLIAESEQSEDELPVIMPSDFEYIFGISASALPHLQQAAQDLRKLVSEPFGQRPNLHKKEIYSAKLQSLQKWNESPTLLFNGASHFLRE